MAGNSSRAFEVKVHSVVAFAIPTNEKFCQLRRNGRGIDTVLLGVNGYVRAEPPHQSRVEPDYTGQFLYRRHRRILRSVRAGFCDVLVTLRTARILHCVGIFEVRQCFEPRAGDFRCEARRR